MSNLVKFVCGIDIGMDTFGTCLMSLDQNQDLKVKATHTYPNTPKGFKELIAWIKKHVKDIAPVDLLVEATGVYHEKLALYLQETGHVVKVVLPNKARKFMQAIGYKSKNDKIDAKGLAMMCAQTRQQPWQPMSKFFYALRQLTRQHESLQGTKTSLVNQLHALEHSAYPSHKVSKQIKRTIALIEKQIGEMKQAIETHVKEDETTRSKIENISRIKGLGLLTIATVIAETNGFALFDSIGQLVSYAGYDVVENQSGKHVGKTKISKKGNSHIRRILYMPSLNMVRYDVYPFKQLYDRIFDRTKIPMKGYTAIQRKLLVIIYALWKKNEAFAPKDITSGNAETAPSFSSTSEKSEGLSKKIAPVKSRAKQDGHPSKLQRMPSFS